MSIFFLTLYIMLWTLGICASYAFVMTVTKKDAPIVFLRRTSLVALLSFAAAWFFGVLYYIQPDTIARFAKAITPSSNVALYTFFMQSRECFFLSFVFIPILSAWLSVIIFSLKDAEGFTKRKNDMVSLSIVLATLSVLAILLAMMIV